MSVSDGEGPYQLADRDILVTGSRSASNLMPCLGKPIINVKRFVPIPESYVHFFHKNIFAIQTFLHGYKGCFLNAIHIWERNT